MTYISGGIMMISAGDFKKGITFEMDGQVYQVLDFQHVKPGKGAAFVRTKYKNIVTGAIQERAFNPSDKFPKAHIETKEMQYLYDDGDLYYFMDTETYEQIPLGKDMVEDAIMYLRPNDMATIKFYKGNAFSVEPPNFVELEVVETEPGFKGDTAQNTFKPATVETGAVIQVPLFVEVGDVIRIDTRTGEYMSRV
jgi:elongation factor P